MVAACCLAAMYFAASVIAAGDGPVAFSLGTKARRVPLAPKAFAIRRPDHRRRLRYAAPSTYRVLCPSRLRATGQRWSRKKDRPSLGVDGPPSERLKEWSAAPQILNLWAVCWLSTLVLCFLSQSVSWHGDFFPVRCVTRLPASPFGFHGERPSLPGQTVDSGRSASSS